MRKTITSWIYALVDEKPEAPMGFGFSYRQVTLKTGETKWLVKCDCGQIDKPCKYSIPDENGNICDGTCRDDCDPVPDFHVEWMTKDEALKQIVEETNV